MRMLTLAMVVLLAGQVSMRAKTCQQEGGIGALLPIGDGGCGYCDQQSVYWSNSYSYTVSNACPEEYPCYWAWRVYYSDGSSFLQVGPDCRTYFNPDGSIRVTQGC